MAKSCYVHVPFCDSICSYCDFSRQIMNKNFCKKWIERLNKEIKSYSIDSLDTLYFGGGTPSLLDVDSFEKIRKLFPNSINEFTVECNPESVTKEKMEVYKNLGVNRISLGVQTFNDDLLKVCHRRHTSKQAIESIRCIRSYIDNLSVDLIFGLPNQTMEDLKRDIQLFLSLDIPHLSIYSLQIEPNSIFGKSGVLPCDEDLEADMFEYIVKTLKEHGYEHYEISSFCKDKKYSIHNLAYWMNEDFYGIGCGASGRLNNIRYDNTKNLNQYIENGPCIKWIDENLTERSFDAIMMALRTKFGLSVSEWNQMYSSDFMYKYKTVLDKYSTYFQYDKDHIYLNESGFELLNTILVDFMMIE